MIFFTKKLKIVLSILSFSFFSLHAMEMGDYPGKKKLVKLSSNNKSKSEYYLNFWKKTKEKFFGKKKKYKYNGDFVEYEEGNSSEYALSNESYFGEKKEKKQLNNGIFSDGEAYLSSNTQDDNNNTIIIEKGDGSIKNNDDNNEDLITMIKRVDLEGVRNFFSLIAEEKCKEIMNICDPITGNNPIMQAIIEVGGRQQEYKKQPSDKKMRQGEKAYSIFSILLKHGGKYIDGSQCNNEKKTASGLARQYGMDNIAPMLENLENINELLKNL